MTYFFYEILSEKKKNYQILSQNHIERKSPIPLNHLPYFLKINTVPYRYSKSSRQQNQDD